MTFLFVIGGILGLTFGINSDIIFGTMIVFYSFLFVILSSVIYIFISRFFKEKFLKNHIEFYESKM